MSQEEVYNTLKESGEPLSAKEIAGLIKRDMRIVFTAINVLVKYKEIKVVEISRQEAMKRFSCKRRMRLYYVD